MKLQWKNSVRASLCAAAVLGAGWAQAQTPAAPVHPAMPTAQHQGEAHHHTGKKAHHPHHRGNSNKYASPDQHEAAAVGQERRQGKGPSNPPQANQLTEFQRNALRRCEVFKTNDDRAACVERVRQPQISGSIAGGGVIREYTQTIQVSPTEAPAQYQSPQHVPQQNHMMHPPVQHIRTQ